MPDRSLTLHLTSPDRTAEFACKLANTLTPGDAVLLSGPVGAGKSHFCRSLIGAILTLPEDIPSPTFTLVQTYDTTAGTLWHSDLYRISSPYEIEELGLTEAFDEAICLVEWPDRLGNLAPENALSIALAYGDSDTSRVLHADWSDDKWAKRLKAAAS